MTHFRNRNIIRAIGFISFFATSILFLSCTQNSNPAGTGGEGDLSNPAIIPAVIFTLPANSGIGPFDIYNPGNGTTRPSFVVQFNKLMDTYSFKTGSITCKGFDIPVIVTLHTNYIIEPLAINKQVSSNQPGKKTSSDYDNVLEFDIRDSATYRQLSYAVGKTYSITIDTSIQDINGNHLSTPYTFSFTPEPRFRVIASNPANGQMGIPTNNFEIYLYFNSPLNPDSRSLIQINPSVGGTWTFSYDSTYIYISSSSPLNFNTTYSVRVPSSASDKYGNHLPNDFVINFITSAFQVSSVYPSNGGTDVSPNTSLSFGMTGPIDTSTVPSAFIIVPGIRRTFSYGESAFGFTPANDFTLNTKYTVTVSTALKATNGTPLTLPFTASFTTSPFEVISITPSAYDPGNSVVSRKASFEVYCNASLDTSTARSAFSITPYVNGAIGFYRYYSTTGYDNFVFYPSSELAANASYTITVSKSLKAFDGTPLRDDYSFSFVTGQY